MSGGKMMLDEQEVFTKIATGMLKQGRLSKDAFSVTCYYRYPGDPTCRCPAGHLIDDDHYIPEFEQKKFSSVIEICRSDRPELIQREWLDHFDMIAWLQSKHDSKGTSYEGFMDYLERVATNYGWEFPSAAE